MNYIITAPIAASMLASASLPAHASEPVIAPAPTSPPDSAPIQWIRTVHADGWVFTLKDTNYRGGALISGDPQELDDYAMHRPDGRPSSTRCRPRCGSTTR